jgi:hypothetical protein
MISSKTVKNVARHLEEQMHEMDKKMIGSPAVSPFAQHKRQAMAQAAEVLRVEAVRIDAGDENVVGPDMFKDHSDPLFGVEGPEDEV